MMLLYDFYTPTTVSIDIKFVISKFVSWGAN